MDPKDDIKKATREKKKKSTKKSTKGKATREKGKKSKTTREKGAEKSFVQTTPVSSSVPTGTGGITGGRDLLGAGGLPGLLQALGVRGKFQSLGGSTGFGAGALAPIQAPVVQRAPAVEPKMKDVIIEPPINIVQRDLSRIADNERKLERKLRSFTRPALESIINRYFGDEGLDYIVKDSILKARTKKGVIEKMAEMDARYGNIDINKFINFKAPSSLAQEVPEGSQFVDSRLPSNGFSTGAGDGMSELSSSGLAQDPVDKEEEEEEEE